LNVPVQTHNLKLFSLLISDIISLKEAFTMIGELEVFFGITNEDDEPNENATIPVQSTLPQASLFQFVSYRLIVLSLEDKSAVHILYKYKSVNLRESF